MRVNFGTAIIGAALAAALAPATAPAALPAARSYAEPASWLCRPEAPGPCGRPQDATIVAGDGTTTYQPWRPASAPAIDCLYYYPTISEDPSGNSDMDAGPEEAHIVEQQFARLGSQCRTFAPVYRSATSSALRAGFSPNPLPVDREIPYLDVRAAFRHYLAHDNKGRGFLLIGHSQGSGLINRLLREEIDGKPVQRQLVSAMILGNRVVVPEGKDVGGDFQSIPLCRAAGQTGCVISYSAYRATVPPPADSIFGRIDTPGMQVACTNPAALSGDGEALIPYFATRGGLFPGIDTWQALPGKSLDTPYATVPGLASARCARTQDGASYLAISVQGDRADPRADDVPGDVLVNGQPWASWGMHMSDVHLAMGNLEKIVALQAAAYQARAK
jgi:hypothetical protein